MDHSEQNFGITNILVEQEMKNSYLEYAMSVIISRAIPDLRDGLKPVQRRILYAMHVNGFTYNKPYKKSAKVVGDVMSKYHPHGDSAIYDTLVRMAQDFSMGTMLIDGQGNFGSIDDDPPAAMRYTEARLQKITNHLLQDLAFNVVALRDNYDGSEQEPVVLPAAYPNILANGSEGIAVGMATSIPPYNLGEIIDACHAYIKNNDISAEEMTQIIHGPDFPTGATIIDKNAIKQTSISGRGPIMMRGVANIEELSNGKSSIIITEIPYQVIKARLIEKIAELVRGKKVDGISNIRDESSKSGMRIVVELKRDASSDVILNQLYKYTQLQTSFSVNMLLLHEQRPTLMTVHGIIKAFMNFREESVIKRLNYLLSKTRDRAHILIGLYMAVDSIDQIITIIRGSQDSAEARVKLMSSNWPASNDIIALIDLVCDRNNTIINGRLQFTEEQVKAILEMRLARLTGLEKSKISAELKELGEEISHYLSTLADRSKVINIISNELHQIKNDFAVPRRTAIIESDLSASDEDLIEKEAILIIITTGGYIKRSSLTEYTSQHRGGKGKIVIQTSSDSIIAQLLIGHTHTDILFFSDHGKVYKLRGHAIPMGSSQSKGRAILNLIPIEKDEKITNIMSMPVDRDTWSQYDLVFATKLGNVRRSNVMDFSKINTNGKIAIHLNDNDALVGVCMATGNDNILLSTCCGMAVRFEMNELRIIKSRTSDGVRGIKLNKDDSVISISILSNSTYNQIQKEQYLKIPVNQRLKLATQNSIATVNDMTQQSLLETKHCDIISDDTESNENTETLSPNIIKSMAEKEQFILTLTSTGYGKRTSSYEYRITARGCKGIMNMKIPKGHVIASFIVAIGDEVMLATKNGKMIRCGTDKISIIGRHTRGVKVIDAGVDDYVVSAKKITLDGITE